MYMSLQREFNIKEFMDKIDVLSNKNLLTDENNEKLDFGNCPICYEKIVMIKSEGGEIKPNHNISVTPCNHAFCFNCLSRHLEKKNKCPICRKKLTNKLSLKPITTYEGCYIINQKVEQHLTHKLDYLLAASDELRDPNILLSNVRYCMYDAMQSLRKLQLVDDSEDEDDDDDGDGF